MCMVVCNIRVHKRLVTPSKKKSFRSDLIAEHKQVMEQLANAEQIAHTNRVHLTTLKSERDEFEKQYRVLSDMHSQCRIREMLNFAKIQDSVNVAEGAIKERDAAIEREKEIRGKTCCGVENWCKELINHFQRNAIAWRRRLAV